MTTTTAPACTPDIRVEIGIEKCVGCLQCATVCRSDALRLLPGAWAVEVDLNRCTACRRCVPACPFDAIEVAGQPRNPHRMVTDTLLAALSSTCPPGFRVTTTPPRFQSAPGEPAAVPDLAVVRVSGAGVEWLGTDEPMVALVVEVVAPSTREADFGPKRDLYWYCGVTTYWTVDQRTGQVTVEWARAPQWVDGWVGYTFG